MLRMVTLLFSRKLNLALRKTKQTKIDKSRTSNPTWESYTFYCTVKNNHSFIQLLGLEFGVLVLISNQILLRNLGKPLRSIFREPFV